MRLIAADDRLFAVTREGRIYCFGAQETAVPATHTWVKLDLPASAPVVKARAEHIIAAADAREGYGIVWGVGDGQLVEALIRQSNMHWIVVEPDPKKGCAISAFIGPRPTCTERATRWSFMAIAPIRRVRMPAVYVGERDDLRRPGGGSAWMATSAPGRKYTNPCQPYGGKICLFASDATRKLASAIAGLHLPGAKVQPAQDMILVVREGALPGSANWTHEHADAANTRVSRDTLVKAPLGVLWFGGPSHEGILPRHGHGPQPQVVDGRMIIEGVDLMRAIDIYTGRLLWETRLPGVGFFYNNLSHQPGANASGSNFVSMPDGIYIAYHSKCVRLDPATGKKISEFTMPLLPGMKEGAPWGCINVAGDYLIAQRPISADPESLLRPPKVGDNGDDKEPGEKKEAEKKESAIAKLFKTVKGFSDNLSASRHLVVMDRHTGKVLWTAAANSAFRHNATCVGGGRLYAIDRLSGEQLARYKRENRTPPHPARLCAFDLQTGKELWSTDTRSVPGRSSSYSAKHDVVVEAGRVARDTLFDEPKGMCAYRAKDGKELWLQKTYTGPAMIHGDTILQDQGGCDLRTGKLKMREDPLTGEVVPWRWVRNYGCNTPAASDLAHFPLRRNRQFRPVRRRRHRQLRRLPVELHQQPHCRRGHPHRSGIHAHLHLLLSESAFPSP